MNLYTLAMFGFPAGSEWIIIGGFALLIFGRRLPDVARSIGKSIVEFKKGLRDVKDDIDQRSKIEASSNNALEDKSNSNSSNSESSTKPESSTKSESSNSV